MDQPNIAETRHAYVMRVLEELTEKVSNRVHDLHLLREAVDAEERRHRTEKTYLHDLKKEILELDSQEKRACAHEAAACHQYEKQARELKEEMDKHREVAVIDEINQKVLVALRDQVTQKENELIELRREKQWKTESFRFSAGVPVDITSRISSDMELIFKKMEEAKKEMTKLNAKRAVGNKILNKIRAHTETEKNAKLELECLIKALCVERRKEQETALISSKQARVRLRHFGPPHIQTNRSVILQELKEEKCRGANLTKELCELMQLATKKATKRGEWLKRQFSADE